MSDFLEQVIAERRADVAAARAAVPDDEIRARAQVGPRRPIDQFFQSLRHRRSSLAVIAEVLAVRSGRRARSLRERVAPIHAQTD